MSVDQSPLFPGCGCVLPVTSIVVNVPLVDFTVESGATEVWPGTHRLLDAEPNDQMRVDDYITRDLRRATGATTENAGRKLVLTLPDQRDPATNTLRVPVVTDGVVRDIAGCDRHHILETLEAVTAS